MKILWMTWKDRSHPGAGGAETVNEELGKRLARDGHEVVFLVAGFGGAQQEEIKDGYKIIRLGDHYSVYWRAYRYYKNNLQGWADVVIDEVNTIPFFCRFYVKEKTILFVHQLCREIWFYQMVFPVNIIGYFLEPLYLWSLSSQRVITVSESTKNDLTRYGFKSDNIRIIPEGIEIDCAPDIAALEKNFQPTLLSLGAMRGMKRTKHQIRAFEIAKESIPDLRLRIAGDASYRYGQETLRMIAKSPYRKAIEYLGRVSRGKKIELMQKSHLIMVTSIKEGWGLIVTEANSQGTPAVTYDVDGLCDSIRHRKTGFLAQVNTPESLAEGIVWLLRDTEKYAKIRLNAWQWSQEFDFERSYLSFLEVLEKI